MLATSHGSGVLPSGPLREVLQNLSEHLSNSKTIQIQHNLTKNRKKKTKKETYEMSLG
jgi:hypothetical protein